MSVTGVEGEERSDYTKAESRYIPNGPGSTANMANATRTGDVVAFAYPPYQFDAETPGTLVALSQFFGQHGYVPDVQDLASNTNMRATFLAGGPAINRGQVGARSIGLCSDFPHPNAVNRTPIDGVFRATNPGLSTEDQERVYEGNARRVYPRLDAALRERSS